MSPLVKFIDFILYPLIGLAMTFICIGSAGLLVATLSEHGGSLAKGGSFCFLSGFGLLVLAIILARYALPLFQQKRTARL